MLVAVISDLALGIAAPLDQDCPRVGDAKSETKRNNGNGKSDIATNN